MGPIGHFLVLVFFFYFLKYLLHLLGEEVELCTERHRGGVLSVCQRLQMMTKEADLFALLVKLVTLRL